MSSTPELLSDLGWGCCPTKDLHIYSRLHCTAPEIFAKIWPAMAYRRVLEDETMRGPVALHGGLPWSGTKILFGPCLRIWCRLDPAFYRQAYETHHGRVPFVEKISQNIILTDLLWEKNNIPTKKQAKKYVL